MCNDKSIPYAGGTASYDGDIKMADINVREESEKNEERERKTKFMRLEAVSRQGK